MPVAKLGLSVAVVSARSLRLALVDASSKAYTLPREIPPPALKVAPTMTVLPSVLMARAEPRLSPTTPLVAVSLAAGVLLVAQALAVALVKTYAAPVLTPSTLTPLVAPTTSVLPSGLSATA